MDSIEAYSIHNPNRGAFFFLFNEPYDEAKMEDAMTYIKAWTLKRGWAVMRRVKLKEYPREGMFEVRAWMQ